MKELFGYVRENGDVGFRNKVLIMPTVSCSSLAAFRIHQLVNGTAYVDNQYGCGQLKPDLELTEKTLINFAKNPNVSSVLLVSLGCESADYEKIADKIAETNKWVELLVIQEVGSTIDAIEKGVRIAKEMVEKNNKNRERVDWNSLILSAECGGSDFTSGIASNPVVGYVMDKVVELGGTTVISETTEAIGAEHILARRAINDEVREKFLKIVKRVENLSLSTGEDIRGSNPSPGNIKGGITTLEEKSLGAIEKGGRKSKLVDAIEYADLIPKKNGLIFMDTPGYDVQSVVGMVAGGSQAVLFTTGRGTPTGNPISPVIKITANPETFKKMGDNIDFDASPIIKGEDTIENLGEKLFSLLVDVLNGKLTKSEILGHQEFGIMKIYQSV
nr:UxaA family hydrolase [Caldisphaera lagunensis]